MVSIYNIVHVFYRKMYNVDYDVKCVKYQNADDHAASAISIQKYDHVLSEWTIVLYIDNVSTAANVIQAVDISGIVSI